MWKVKIEGIVLPEGWQFKEDQDFLYLIGPDNKKHLCWSCAGISKEDIRRDIELFFSRGQS